MEKNEYAPYVLIIYVLVIIILFSLFGCSRTLYVGAKYSDRCPTNNKSFFYERMGVRPSKQYLKYGGK